MFHNGEELSLVDLAVTILVELVDHGLQLVVVEVLLHLAGHTAKVTQGDLASAVLVEQLEGLGDLFDRVALADLSSHDLEEVGILDLAGAFAVELPHQVEHLLLLDVEAEGTHAHLQLVVVDGAGLVSVEELEGFLDLLLLLV